MHRLLSRVSRLGRALNPFIAYGALLGAILAAGCAPIPAPPRPDGARAVFVFWMEYPDAYARLGKASAADVEAIFTEAGFRVVRADPGRSPGRLPPPLRLYDIGKRQGADVAAFCRIIPMTTGRKRRDGLEIELFDFRTGEHWYAEYSSEPVLGTSGWKIRWGILELQRNLEKIRQRHDKPYDKNKKDTWAEGPDRAVIGVQPEPADPAALTGARITSVVPGGPADRAGARPGDILTAVDQTPVHVVQDLLDAVTKRRIGQSVTLTIQRGPDALRLRMKTTSLKKLYGSAWRAMEGKSAPDFAFTPHGRPKETRLLSELRGRYVLVDIWSPLSLRSVRELMVTRRLHERWGPKGLAVVSIVADDPAAAKPILESGFMRWGHALDPSRKIARQYRIPGLPARFLLDPKGVVIAAHLRGSEMERLIRSRLAPQKSQGTQR